MTDPTRPVAGVRPMTSDDYSQGRPVAVVPVGDHPTRDLVIGAVVGAVALWAVPRVLDAVMGRIVGDEGAEEYDLEIDE